MKNTGKKIAVIVCVILILISLTFLEGPIRDFSRYLTLITGQATAVVNVESCSTGWYITGYYTPVESDYSGPTKTVEVTNLETNEKITRSHIESFLNAVSIEGWGLTILADYIGGWNNQFWGPQSYASDSLGNQLKTESIAVDPSIIPHGKKIMIPTLPSPWNQKIFTASDIGPSIVGKNIDVFTGEGTAGEQETFRITGDNNEVCVVSVQYIPQSSLVSTTQRRLMHSEYTTTATTEVVDVIKKYYCGNHFDILSDDKAGSGGPFLTACPDSKMMIISPRISSIQTTKMDHAKQYGFTQEDIISYDLEGWDATPQEEKDNPVTSMHYAADFVHSKGYSFAADFSGDYWLAVWPDLDYRKFDYNMIQFQRWSRNDNGVLIQNIKPIVELAKSQNPNINNIIQISFRQSSNCYNKDSSCVIDVTQSLNNLKNTIDKLAEVPQVDGVRIVYLPDGSNPCDTKLCNPQNFDTILGYIAAKTIGTTIDNPPTVSVSRSPSSPTPSQSVTFTASSADDKGLVSVEIFVDGSSLGSCSAGGTSNICAKVAGPYSAGSTHNYYAKATDSNDQATQSSTNSFSIATIDNPPTASISHSPLNPDSSSIVTFTATASDDVGLTSLEIFVGGSLLGSCTTSQTSKTCIKTGGPYTGGTSYLYYARAFDTAGNSGTSSTSTFSVQSIDNFPIVSVSHLPLSPTSSDTISFTATSTDDIGLTKIEIFVDNNLLGTCTVSGTSQSCTKTSGPFAAGTTHNYYSKATDTNGQVSSSSAKSFTVQDGSNNLPVASVSHSPVSPSATDVITFTATAADDIGLKAVQIFVDGSLVGSCTTSQTSKTCIKTSGPYSAGSTHTYYAVAIDTIDQTGQSSPSTFTVKSPAPAINNPPTSDVSHSPLNPNSGETITFTASATDDIGLSTIQIFVDSLQLGSTCSVSGKSATCSRTNSYSSGTHNYYAKSTDSNGNSTNSATKTFSVKEIILVDNPPSVSVSHSPNKPFIGDSVAVTASAADDFGLSSIQIFVDGISAGTCTVTTKSSACTKTVGPYSAESTHLYYAVAIDSSSKSKTSATNNFSVKLTGANRTNTTRIVKNNVSADLAPALSSTELRLVDFDGSSATINFTKYESHDILNLTIDPTESVEDVQISVENLSTKPASVEEADGEIYKYLEINKSGLDDTKIDSAKIRFKVNKEWILGESINISTIALERYNANVWNKLGTILAGSEDDFYIFESDTPGFSTFAITGEAVLDETTETQTEPAAVASSSGGGGGGKSSSSVSTVPKNETKEISIGEQGTIVKLDNQLGHGIVSISVEVNRPASGVIFNVKSLDTKPENIGDAGGSVYRYLEISKSGISDEDIKKVNIFFQVERGWIIENNIDWNTVSLNRFVDGSWEKLPTKFTGFDGGLYIYESSSEGFSTFAITGEVASGPVQEPVIDKSGADSQLVPGYSFPLPGGAENLIRYIIIGAISTLGAGFALFFVPRMRRLNGGGTQPKVSGGALPLIPKSGPSRPEEFSEPLVPPTRYSLSRTYPVNDINVVKPEKFRDAEPSFDQPELKNTLPPQTETKTDEEPFTFSLRESAKKDDPDEE